MSTSIFEDPEKLMELRKQYNDARKEYADRMWETLKFFTTIFSALLAASSVIILAYMREETLHGMVQIKVLILLLPIAILFISFLGLTNLRREYRRAMEQISVLKKIEGLLGIYDHESFRREIKGKPNFPYPEDSTLLPQRYEEDGACGKSENWIDKMMSFWGGPKRKGKARFLPLFTSLFIVYIIISIVLLLVALTY